MKSATTVLYLLLGLLLTASAMLIRSRSWYTPGSDFGYALGLTGGILMLRCWYPMKSAFAACREWDQQAMILFHMVCGVVGPLAIIYHSSFRVDSQNALVAMSAMILVAGSGIVGRFVYVRIHNGLSGQEWKLDDLEGDEESRSLNFNRDMHWAPDVVAALKLFRDRTRDMPAGKRAAALAFISLPVREWRVRNACRRALAGHLDRRASERKWDVAKRALRQRQFERIVREYTAAVVRRAQYGAYKRIFALWHVLHLPFVFLLAASAAYHVLAVHMY
jgi:hypothetical protein